MDSYFCNLEMNYTVGHNYRVMGHNKYKTEIPLLKSCYIIIYLMSLAKTKLLHYLQAVNLRATEMHLTTLILGKSKEMH